jgi:arginase
MMRSSAASVVLLPQWQGTVSPAARQLVSGAARLADLVQDMGARVLKPDGFDAGRSPMRQGVESYDVLLDTRALISRVLPDAPLLAIGGDCGADLGPAARELERSGGELAIVWLDAHADFNTPATSPSGAFHGMVLRALTGVGPDGLTAPVPAAASSLVLAGTRSVDPAEQHELAAAGVMPLGMRALIEPASVADQLRRTGCPAVHIHLDLDVLDPEVFPYTTYQEPGGATIDQVLGLLEIIDSTLPVTSAFVGEHLGGDERDTAAVAPLLRQLLSSIGRSAAASPRSEP